jgi:hypothetical protein
VLKATGAHVLLRFRQMLEIRCGQITFSIISFDMQDLVRQLKVADDSRHLVRDQETGTDRPAREVQISTLLRG